MTLHPVSEREFKAFLRAHKELVGMPVLAYNLAALQFVDSDNKIACSCKFERKEGEVSKQFFINKV
jgi:hypothetical protein